jgi:serine/threonine protein kinase
MGSPRRSFCLNSSVMYSVLELASGGELLQYLIHGGRFDEAITRFYFLQLIDALEYLHQSGYVHRNIRPEHLLLDEHYNLQLSNFSSSIEACGRDGTGLLRTLNSMTAYSAPEIQSKAPYSGVSVDLFAAGVILFIMFSGIPPFGIATSSDHYYRLLAAKDYDKFWAFHSKQRKQADFYPPGFRSIVSALLALDPADRPTMDEVRAHPWCQEQVASPPVVANEMRRRQLQVEESIAQRRVLIAQARLNQQNKPTSVGFRGVCPCFRGTGLQMGGTLDSNEHMNSNLQGLFSEGWHPKIAPQPFDQSQMLKFSMVLSGLSPFELLKSLAYLCDLLYKNVEVHQEDWSVRTSIPGRSMIMKLKMQVLACEGLSIVEFVKEEGDLFELATVVEKISSQLEEEEGARL